MEERKPWEQMEGESNLWYSRFVIYLQMGPSRTLLGAVHLEEAQKAEKGRERQSSKTPGAWNRANDEWKWKERADDWDKFRREQVFVSGNAYDLERIEKLNKYSKRLEAEIDKMLDALEKKEIDKPWFNQFLYEKYLETLEALSAETGGRAKKQEHTGKDGGPIEVEYEVIFGGGSIPEEEESGE